MSAERPWNDFDQLHLVQAQLAAAQAAEVEALRALTSYTLGGGMDPGRFDALTHYASEARARTDRVLTEWKELVRIFSRSVGGSPSPKASDEDETR